MTQYILVDNNDITRLVCEENIVVKNEKLDLVICTAEYYVNNVIKDNEIQFKNGSSIKTIEASKPIRGKHKI